MYFVFEKHSDCIYVNAAIKYKMHQHIRPMCRPTIYCKLPLTLIFYRDLSMKQAFTVYTLTLGVL